MAPPRKLRAKSRRIFRGYANRQKLSSAARQELEATIAELKYRENKWKEFDDTEGFEKEWLWQQLDRLPTPVLPILESATEEYLLHRASRDNEAAESQEENSAAAPKKVGRAPRRKRQANPSPDPEISEWRSYFFENGKMGRPKGSTKADTPVHPIHRLGTRAFAVDQDLNNVALDPRFPHSLIIFHRVTNVDRPIDYCIHTHLLYVHTPSTAKALVDRRSLTPRRTMQGSGQRKCATGVWLKEMKKMMMMPR